MTVLSPMCESEFAAYLAFAIPDFAQDKVQAGQSAPAESLEPEVQQRGLSGIALHHKLGYLPTNINLFKQLSTRAPD